MSRAGVGQVLAAQRVLPVVEVVARVDDRQVRIEDRLVAAREQLRLCGGGLR